MADCVVYKSSVCTWHESSSIYCRRWDEEAKVIKVSAESRLAERIGQLFPKANSIQTNVSQNAGITRFVEHFDRQNFSEFKDFMTYRTTAHTSQTGMMVFSILIAISVIQSLRLFYYGDNKQEVESAYEDVDELEMLFSKMNRRQVIEMLAGPASDVTQMQSISSAEH